MLLAGWLRVLGMLLADIWGDWEMLLAGACCRDLALRVVLMLLTGALPSCVVRFVIIHNLHLFLCFLLFPLLLFPIPSISL